MFSSTTQYALRAVLFLSSERQNHSKLRVEDIAKKLELPKAYLSKILQQLSKNNLISSSKGRGGGFYLSEENRNKTLMDIVLCIEGHDVFDKCLLGLENCGEENPCYLHSIYKRFKKELVTVVKDMSIEDLFLINT